MWYTVCGILYSSGILYTVRALHLLFSSALGGAQDGLLHWSHWSYPVVLNAVVGVTPLALHPIGRVSGYSVSGFYSIYRVTLYIGVLFSLYRVTASSL